MLYRRLTVLLCVILLISTVGYVLYHSDGETAAQGEAGRATAVFEPFSQIPIVDPGHGGLDGGTTSLTGVLESQINLEIGLKTDLLLRFLGLKTVMTRDTDVSIHDIDAGSIRDQKMSDLKNRVRLVNETENGVLLSIHQNFFEQSQYHGAQVFYNGASNKPFADIMQEALRQMLDPENNRKSKTTDNVYLLNHITKPAVLIECGFLSNPAEEALLRSEGYQRKVAITVCKGFLDYTKGRST